MVAWSLDYISIAANTRHSLSSGTHNCKYQHHLVYSSPTHLLRDIRLEVDADLPSLFGNSFGEAIDYTIGRIDIEGMPPVCPVITGQLELCAVLADFWGSGEHALGGPFGVGE
jgi:hypothetical protein